MPFYSSPIIPYNNEKFYLIEDVYLKGSLRIVPDLDARNNLGANTIEAGTLVRCLDTLKFWRAESVTVGEDEFGDPSVDVVWSEFTFPTADSLIEIPKLYEMSRFSKTINIGSFADKKSISTPIDLQCYSCMMFDLSVDVPLKVEIYSRQDFKDRNPYTFIARYDHLIDDGSSLIQNKNIADFWLKTTAYSIIVNEDEPLQTTYQLKITKNKSLTAHNAYSQNEVTISFAYIPLEI